MPQFSFLDQFVNGDPMTSGGNINITTSGISSLSFDDADGVLGPPGPGDTISVDGGAPQSYQVLGTGDVRGDPLQNATFIRLDDGTTFAIDLNADGDDVPDLQNGNTKLRVRDFDQS